MIELHLIGYTEDREFLVLDLDADGPGRYELRIDPDLLATLTAVRLERFEAGLPVDIVPPEVSGGTVPRSDGIAPASEDGRSNHHPSPTVAEPPVGAAPSRPQPVGPADAPAGSDRAVTAVEAGRAAAAAEADPAGSFEVGDAPSAGNDPPLGAVASRDEVVPSVEVASTGDVVPPAPRLTPAEIQARLRQGRSVKAVAEEAETDPAWIERWLGPVVAEQARILEEARRQPLEGGRARRALGPAVDAALRDRGIDPDEARWKVARRQDGRWKLTLRYADKGRPRSATWLYDRESQSVRAASQHAGSLVGRGRRRG